jgi:hypothetical protein
VVVNEIAQKRSQDYFRLATDLPAQRQLMFDVLDTDKKTVRSLEGVQGYDEVKKEFFKDHRFNKSMPFRIIIPYVILAGLITWLIVGQN